MVTLNEQQRAWLTACITRNQPAHSIIRWLENGAVVEFTDPSFTYSNAEFKICHSESHKIWFSQLSNFGMDDEFKLCCGDIVLRDGTKQTIVKLDVNEFWNIVQGKEFLVYSPDFVKYVFDTKSEEWRDKYFPTYKDAWDFVIECVEKGQYEDLFGIIKPGSVYSLIER